MEKQAVLGEKLSRLSKIIETVAIINSVEYDGRNIEQQIGYIKCQQDLKNLLVNVDDIKSI
jgi:hypothetical protein